MAQPVPRLLRPSFAAMLFAAPPGVPVTRRTRVTGEHHATAGPGQDPWQVVIEVLPRNGVAGGGERRTATSNMLSVSPHRDDGARTPRHRRPAAPNMSRSGARRGSGRGRNGPGPASGQ